MSTKIKTPEGWKDVSGGGVINDDTTSVNTTWSSEKISYELASLINDDTTSVDTTWSSRKINAALATKQDKLSGVVTGSRSGDALYLTIH